MPRLSRHRLAVLAALGCLVGSSGARAGKPETMVFAAASLTNALQEIARVYESRGGGRVVFSFGASSTLARQIAEGAPADLFVSADEAKMDDLEARGAIDAGSRRDLLSNALVVVVPAGSRLAVRKPADLAGPALRVLALAEPRSVPAGIYAREFLERAGVWTAVADRVVPTDNVRAALAAVEAGNADAAIVYATDAAIGRGIEVAYRVPRSESPRIAYPAARVRGGKSADAASFLGFLGSEPAQQVFRRFGFLVDEGER